MNALLLATLALSISQSDAKPQSPSPPRPDRALVAGGLGAENIPISFEYLFLVSNPLVVVNLQNLLKFAGSPPGLLDESDESPDDREITSSMGLRHPF